MLSLNKKLLLLAAFVLPAFLIFFVKYNAKALQCNGFMTDICNQQCVASETITETPYSYISSAWRGSGISWDDQVGYSAVVNGNTVMNVNQPNPPQACGDVAAGNGVWIPVTFFNGNSGTANDSITLALVAQQKRTTEPNYFWGSVSFGYSVVTCNSQEIVVNNSCVDIGGTISADPINCNAPCSPTITWNKTSGQSASVHVNGTQLFEGDSGSEVHSNLSAGNYTYTLFVVDGFGEPYPVDDVEVTVNAVPGGVVTCSPDIQTVLPGSSANFTAGGGSSYNWSAPGGTPSSGSGDNFAAQYGAAGNYTVTVTDGSTSGTCNVTVSSNSSTCSVTVDPSSIPIGGSATWSVNSVPPGFTFDWYGTDNFGSGPQNVGPVAGGTTNYSTGPLTYNQDASYNRYAILSDNTVCSGSNLCVGTCASPTPTPTPQPGGISCSVSPNPSQTGQSVTATAVGGTGPYDWTRDGVSDPNWQNIGNTFSSTFNAAGVHSFGVTDNTGSNASCSVNVTFVEPPQATNIVLKLSTDHTNWSDDISGNVPISGVDMKVYFSNGFAVSFYTNHIQLQCANSANQDIYNASVDGINAFTEFWDRCNYNNAGFFTLRVNAYGSGFNSNTVIYTDTATVNVTMPAFTFNPLTSTCNGSTPRVTMSWAAHPGVDHYRVDTPQASNVNVGNVTTYTVNSSNGGFGFYAVRAYNSSGLQIATASPTFRSFTTPYCVGNVTVNATLDGAPWGGNIRYSLTGPSVAESGNDDVSLPSPGAIITQQAGANDYECDVNEPTLCWWLFNNPSYFGAQTVWCGVDAPYYDSGSDTIYGDDIYCDDNPLDGNPGFVKFANRTGTYLNLTQGNWTVTYFTGGPAGSNLTSITPSQTQTLPGNLAVKPTLTFTINFTTPGIPEAPGVVPQNTSINAAVECSDIRLLITDQSTNEDGWVIFRNTSNSTSTATKITTITSSTKPLTGSVYTYTDEALPTGILYHYWVQSYAVTEPSVLSSNPNNYAYTSISPTACSANLNTSDKDIVAINGVNIGNGLGNQCGVTDALPSGLTLALGDVLKFSVNLCNSGVVDATAISLADTLLNLKEPAGGWNAKYDDGAGEDALGSGGASGISLSVSGSEPNQTLTFSGMPNVPAAAPPPGIRRITFEAQLTVSPGYKASTARMQNCFRVDYNYGGGMTFATACTPLLPFTTNLGTPTIIEVP